MLNLAVKGYIMYLRRINLINFKTYSELDLEFSPRVNCFVGNNGVGKTNLFDSFHYLAFSKSYFGGSDSETVKHGAGFFLVEGEFEFDDRTEKIQCVFNEDQKKRLRRNGKEYTRLADHIGLVPMVMVSPADSSLILEGSEERRRYMNSVISQYDRQYLEDLIQYNKALGQRNKSLKDFARNHQFDEDLLSFWDQKLVDTGTRIYLSRKNFLTELMPVFQHYYQIISSGKETVGLSYQSQLEETPLKDLLQEYRERDRQLQFTSAGIHRDDLLLKLSGYPMKLQGSQGQQKTFLIALKMAQYDFLKEVSEVRPLILLDDVFDKLDSRRVTEIMKLVAEDHFGQIFITDTNQEHLEAILATIPVEYRLFRIDDEQVITL